MSKVDINEYHDVFTRRFKEIKESLELETADVSSLKTETVKLKNEIESVSHTLPRYQQLSYSENIQSLLDIIDKKTRPQRRFKLSNRSTSTKKEHTKAKIEIPNEFKTKIAEPIVSQIEQSVIHITQREGLVTQIKDSIIIADNVDSITFKNISSSILIINCSGPVFIFALDNCSIFAKCHQLRIHDTISSKFKTDIPSKGAIIENCKELLFNEGISINDFQYPNGNSPNYKNHNYPSEFIEIPSLIENDSDESLKNITNLLKI